MHTREHSTGGCTVSPKLLCLRGRQQEPESRGGTMSKLKSPCLTACEMSCFLKTFSSLQAKGKVKGTWSLRHASLQSSSAPCGSANIWGAGNETEKKLQVVVPVLLQGEGAPSKCWVCMCHSAWLLLLPKSSTCLALPCTYTASALPR